MVAVDPTARAPGPGRDRLGFGSLSPYRDRPAYATTVENSVYVDAAHRGEGSGGSCWSELIDLATPARLPLGDRPDRRHNEASIALHRACGFELVGVEREVGRKHGRWLDVVELQRIL